MKRNLFFLLFVCFSFAYGQTYSGGEGTLSNPFLISNLNDLRYLSEHKAHWSRFFLQTQDIDASETITWNSGKGFFPIGNFNNEGSTFQGSYDGGGKKIIGLYIKRPAELGVGLFSKVWNIYEGGALKNIILEGGEITGGEYTGALVGEFLYGTVINCKSSVKITGTYKVGGLIGIVKGNTANILKNCSASGDVEGKYHSYTTNVGGLIGETNVEVTDSYATGNVILNISNDSGYAGGLIGSAINITNCYATGNVTTSYGVNAGGLAGGSGGKVTNCYATGNITGTSAGGLIGSFGGKISGCYATGNVIGISYPSRSSVGGLIGYSLSSSLGTTTINLCYSTGDVSGDEAGGLIGGSKAYRTEISNCYSRSKVTSTVVIGGLAERISRGFIKNCYVTGELKAAGPYVSISGISNDVGSASLNDLFWDLETTKTNIGVTFLNYDGGRTTNQMKIQNTFKNWDFVNIWAIHPQINDGYPYLKLFAGGTLSSPEVELKNNIIIYPTVTKGSVNIKSDRVIYQYDIYDFSGRKMKDGNPDAKSFTLNLEYLTKGSYIIQLSDEKGITSKKIIKQ